MKKKILIVDDESRMRKLIRDYLEKGGFEVLEAADGLSAISLFQQITDISLIILDVMMPFMDGYETCKKLKSESNVPIIMLTAKTEEEDELLGFQMGADEYISKPFRPKILVARVEAILNRTSANINDTESLEYGGIKLNKTTHTVMIDNDLIDLSFKEFELLSFFMEHINIALSREKILSQVWNYDYYGDARTIDTHVKKLRSKLGSKGDLIKTIWGMGYKFEF